MEHLTPKGRSGIVVPEGIIFQSGTAYKSLRKTLVEKYLIGVISLPSGVFQPYSGVKTSILILDKELSQKTDKIFFGKVENDGFDLGAQRREIDKNDLPILTKEVTEYLEGLRKGTIVESEKLTYVQKEQILSSIDIGFSYDRYVKSKQLHTIYPKYNLGELCELRQGLQVDTELQSKENKDGFSPFLRIINYTQIGSELRYIPTPNLRYFVDKTDVIMVRYGDAGFVGRGYDGVIANNLFSINPINDELKKDFLFHLLKSDVYKKILKSKIQSSGLPAVNHKTIKEIEIPLPPIEVQEEIVHELEQYQKIIDGAKQVVDNYKPVIDIDANWEMMGLSEITEVITKGSTPTTYGYKYQEKGINFIKIENLNDDGVIEKDKLSYIDEKCYNDFKRSQLKKDDILFSIAGTKMGIIGYVEEDILPSNTNQALCIIRLKDTTKSRFIFYYLKSKAIQEHIEKVKVGVAQSNISLKQIGELKIPVITKKEEQTIVERIEVERQIIEGNKKLIEIYTKKIQNRINKIWGE
jgi:type I restriction enzyme M protein